ncbi:hypothetical protein [Streptomyces sp. NBC_00162]|uniref:hypothetical protein n=1 Tax=Streptomyces sp. NBC_00162 TaxID=2903629 RepID=UPI003A4C557B
MATRMRSSTAGGLVVTATVSAVRKPHRSHPLGNARSDFDAVEEQEAEMIAVLRRRVRRPAPPLSGREVARPGHARPQNARDEERLIQHSESLITWAAITLMAGRITRRQFRRASRLASREHTRD